MEIKISSKEAISLDEYNGTFSIVACQVGNDGKIYKKWGYESYRKDGKSVPGDKIRPVAIRLGDKENAVNVLHSLINALEPTESEIPF
jgi:hypothetical protein